MIHMIGKNKTLFVAIVLYGIVAFAAPTQLGTAAQNSLYYFKELFEVIPLILFMTAMIDAWVPQHMIVNKIGAHAGAKGYFFSLLIGSVSAGPIYAAFSVTKMLYKKGASISNITVILSAWAVIKLPMLINEAKFLGAHYMVLRWSITVLAVVIMGWLMGKLVQRQDVKSVMVECVSTDPVQINKAYCIGCGICVRMAPEIFEVNNKKAGLKVTKGLTQERLLPIVQKCPAKAIVLGE